LGLPSDPAKATRLIWSGVSGHIDVDTCHGRYFLNMGRAGLDTKVAMATKGRRGWLSGSKLAYALAALQELARSTNTEFILELDGQRVPTRSLLVAEANGRYLGGGMKMCPEADLTDGLLDVCVSGDLSRVEALALLPAMYRGWHVRHHKVNFYRASTVRLEGPRDVHVQLDGEIMGTLPAEFRVVPHALRIVGWTPNVPQLADHQDDDANVMTARYAMKEES
jgi:diacylglycerol kinase (ATP)